MKRQRFINFLFFVFFLIALSVQSQTSYGERIISYHSDIVVDITGRVLVTERIKFKVTGESIQRGIVRSLPIFRKDIDGKSKRVDVTILSVKRNERSENFMTERAGNNFEVYIGNKDKILSHDIHEYTISYESYGHVGFFEDYDEIYWNVTGNDWAFRIDTVSATVHVPQGASILSNSCYTGVVGSTEKNCLYEIVGDSVVKFYAKDPLSLYEGFTVATSFTPHLIGRPKPEVIRLQSIRQFWENLDLSFLPDFSFTVFGIGIILLWGYVRRLKSKYGNISNIVPSFNPPEGKSAAQLRYVYKQEFDIKCFSAILISLAVKNAVVIHQNKRSYTIHKKDENLALTDEERVVMKELFELNESVELKFGYNFLWAKIFKSVGAKLGDMIRLQDYFRDKSRLVTRSKIISILLVVTWSILLSVFSNLTVPLLVASVVVVLFFSFFVFLITMFDDSIAERIFMSIFICPFIIFLVGFPISFLYIHGHFEAILTIVFFALIVVINSWISKKILPKTQKGLQFMSDLEGFKMYLKTVEEECLNFLTPPDKTPQQFENMLPYAVALDLESKWTKKFRTSLAKANYKPTWYQGRGIEDYSTFSHKLRTSFESLLNSATTKRAPKNTSSNDDSSGRDSWSSGRDSWSSGSGGSGSSGGGGGGGGGRGW